MTTEERVNQYYWWVLSGIQEQILTTPKDQFVCYKLSHVAAAGVPNNETEKNILWKLQDLGAIKVRDNPWEPPFERHPNPENFYLDIIQPKFNDIYTQYKELVDPGSIYKLNLPKKEKPKLRSLAETSSYANISASIAVTDLQSKYQELAEEKDLVQFYIKLAHYGQYILENGATMYILESLYEEAKNDAKPYISAWQRFYLEWKVLAVDILDQAKKVGIIDDNPLSNEITDITGKLQRSETSLWESDISNYYMSYWYLIRKFDSIGKINLLIPKHLASSESMLTITEIYNEARNEWDKFKHSREAKVWWAHYQICRLAAGILDLQERERYFKDDNVVDGFYKFEFEEISKGRASRHPIVLHENKYRVWIKRLHEYLIPRLQNVDMNLVIAKYRQKMHVEDQHANAEETSWSDKFKWTNETDFYLDESNKISFVAKSSDRKTVFQMLTNVKGAWVKVSDMANKIGKTHNRVRSILAQLNREKLEKSGIILIVPKSDTNEPGAYKIKLTIQN